VQSEQLAQLLDCEPGLFQDRAERAWGELAVYWNDDGATVWVAQLAVATALAAKRETGAFQGTYSFGP
jgi:hypothetical protein